MPTPRLLLDRFPNRVRFIFRHFPLEDAHPHALAAAEAAEAAAGQGKFWQMHDLLFAHQAHLKDADLKRYADELGLDSARYVAEMDDHIYLQRVREHAEGGRRSHLRATPTFSSMGWFRTSHTACRACTRRSRPRCTAPDLDGPSPLAAPKPAVTRGAGPLNERARS